MAAIGIVLVWAGYSIFYYGLNTVTGGNESLRALIWPGAYRPAPRDGGGVSDAQRQSDLNQALLPPTGTFQPGQPPQAFNPFPPAPGPNLAPGTLINIP